jgi:hypothetical protein
MLRTNGAISLPAYMPSRLEQSQLYFPDKVTHYTCNLMYHKKAPNTSTGKVTKDELRMRNINDKLTSVQISIIIGII